MLVSKQLCRMSREAEYPGEPVFSSSLSPAGCEAGALAVSFLSEGWRLESGEEPVSQFRSAVRQAGGILCHLRAGQPFCSIHAFN